MPNDENLFRRALQRRVTANPSGEQRAAGTPTLRPSATTQYLPAIRPYESDDAIAVESRGLALVLEDDPITNSAIGSMVGDAGWNVISARSIAEARRVLGVLHPGLLVLDYDVDGELAGPLLDELIAAGRSMPTILASASPLAVDAAVAYGVELLRAPFGVDALEATIVRVTRTRGSVPHIRATH